MEKIKEYTLKRHLISFLLFVIGSMLCLNVYTLLFSRSYNERYRLASQNISQLSSYALLMEDAMKDLRRYTQYSTEDEEDYLQIRSYMEAGSDALDELFNHTNDVDMLRSLHNMMEIHNRLTEEIENIHHGMTGVRSDAMTFVQVNENYREAEAIYEVLHEEYTVTNQICLSYLDSISMELRVKNPLFLGGYLLVFAVIASFLWREIKEIYRSVWLPVQGLVHGADQVQQGVFKQVQIAEQKVKIDRDISLLMHTFNRMTEQLKHQIEVLEENMRIQKKLDESRFRELQMQINPHFMFNTLTMISETAYFENAPKTVFLLNKTAKMFRFSLDFSGTSISLFQELEELENYIFIQEQQCEDRISFLFDLDESFHDILIPSLTLQPLIENSVTHGIGKYTEGGWVKLITRYCAEEGAGYIVVEDNGEGMEEERLRQVREDMEHYQGESVKIGLGNVYSRLKMLYGSRVSMEINSTKGEGTQVSVRIECQRGEKTCID